MTTRTASSEVRLPPALGELIDHLQAAERSRRYRISTEQAAVDQALLKVLDDVIAGRLGKNPHPGALFQRFYWRKNDAHRRQQRERSFVSSADARAAIDTDVRLRQRMLEVLSIAVRKWIVRLDATAAMQKRGHEKTWKEIAKELRVTVDQARYQIRREEERLLKGVPLLIEIVHAELTKRGMDQEIYETVMRRMPSP